MDSGIPRHVLLAMVVTKALEQGEFRVPMEDLDDVATKAFEVDINEEDDDLVVRVEEIDPGEVESPFEEEDDSEIITA